MQISVLIATYNRPALLLECLSALSKSRHPSYEIVVVDQSDDGSDHPGLREFLGRVENIRYVRAPRPGKALAINQGARIATGDFLALTDDDVIVDERWLESIEELRTRHPGVEVFCGRVLPERGTEAGDYLNLVLGERERWIDRRSNPLNTGFCGANIVIRRQRFIEIGGYDPRFGPGAEFKCVEDGELAYRLARNGTPILYSPELFVYHKGWRRETDNVHLRLSYAFGLGAFGGHYLRRGDPRPALYLSKKLVFKAGRLGAGLIRGRRDRMIDGYLHLRGFSGGFVKGILTARTGADDRR